MKFPMAIVALGWALVSYIIYKILSSFLLLRQNAAKALELKCEEPPLQRNRYPFGIDNIMRAIRADKAKLFPVDMIQRTVEVGATTYKYSALGMTGLFTADEKNIQALLATQFQDFDIGPLRRGNFWPLLGNGIFTQDGKGWEHSRAMMRPQFGREQVSDLDLEERHVQNLMLALDSSLQSNNWTETLDLQVLFFHLTLDSATEFLFGQSVDSQLARISSHTNPNTSITTGPNNVDFASSFDTAQSGLATRSRFADKYWLVNPKGFKESCKDCHIFIDHYVQLALSKELRAKELEKESNPEMKEKYVFLEALATQTQDPIELRSQLLHILLAGRDTTASLLGWLFFSLSRDPAVYNKLREIILQEFGTYSDPNDITFAKLKSCTYLQHCTNEALRMYPVVPINSRMSNKDTTLPRGGGKDGKSKIFIPKGTVCDYGVHAMHRRKDIWGEDAEAFRPERWVGRKVGWEYLPFNGGPRICIGQQFATIEANYVTVRLLQRYDKMESMETDPSIRHNLTLTNCSANGVKVRAHAVT